MTGPIDTHGRTLVSIIAEPIDSLKSHLFTFRPARKTSSKLLTNICWTTFVNKTRLLNKNRTNLLNKWFICSTNRICWTNNKNEQICSTNLLNNNKYLLTSCWTNPKSPKLVQQMNSLVQQTCWTTTNICSSVEQIFVPCSSIFCRGGSSS